MVLGEVRGDRLTDFLRVLRVLFLTFLGLLLVDFTRLIDLGTVKPPVVGLGVFLGDLTTVLAIFKQIKKIK
jgi:hypothetical protein